MVDFGHHKATVSFFRDAPFPGEFIRTQHVFKTYMYFIIHRVAILQTSSVAILAGLMNTSHDAWVHGERSLKGWG